MEFHLWLSFVVICIMGALSPGPSLALVIKNTLAGGTSQGYATAISHGLGVALYAAITATGIAVIIVKSPLIFSIIQYLSTSRILEENNPMSSHLLLPQAKLIDFSLSFF